MKWTPLLLSEVNVEAVPATGLGLRVDVNYE